MKGQLVELKIPQSQSFKPRDHELCSGGDIMQIFCPHCKKNIPVKYSSIGALYPKCPQCNKTIKFKNKIFPFIRDILIILIFSAFSLFSRSVIICKIHLLNLLILFPTLLIPISLIHIIFHRILEWEYRE